MSQERPTTTLREHLTTRMAAMTRRSTSWRGMRDAYRAMLPVKQVLALAAECDTWLDVAFQDALIGGVVRDAICDKYPPQRAYTYRLLKSYLAAIERESGDVSDLLVEALLEYVASGQPSDPSTLDPDSVHYITHSVSSARSDDPTIPANSDANAADADTAAADDGIAVTCRVATVFNEVGMKLWEAGWFLAEFVLAHRAWFQDRCILELGAGVGFSGLVLAKCVRARHIVLSDYAPKVLQNLRYNVEINHPYLCPVDVASIDWGEWPQGDELEVMQPDVLIAGDCVYDVAAFPEMMHLLGAFLHAAAHTRVAYFAATIRNRATFQAFLEHLAAHAIEYEDITTSSLEAMGAPLFQYENREQIRLCRLTRRRD